MNIIYTIGTVLVILATILATCLLVASLNHSKVNKLYAVVMSLLLVVGVIFCIWATQQPRLDKYYGEEDPASYERIFPDAYYEGYNKGYSDAIIDAGLYSEEAQLEAVENWLYNIKSIVCNAEKGKIIIVDGNGGEYVLYTDGNVPALGLG